MKTLVLCAAAALALAGAAQAQSAGQSSSITADLNRAPTTQTAPRQTTPPTATPSTTPAPAATSPTASRLAPPPQTRPAPVAAPRPTPAPAAQAEPDADEAEIEADTEIEAAAEPAPPPPAPPLTAAQIAALPFTLSLPTGFRIVESASGDDFDLWTVRRGDAPAFVTIYAGERSNYPIYGGREITAGGRTSVVVNEGQGDRAMEHIFLRSSAPREVHIWVGSVADADRAVAEAIAQSVDVR